MWQAFLKRLHEPGANVRQLGLLRHRIGVFQLRQEKLLLRPSGMRRFPPLLRVLLRKYLADLPVRWVGDGSALVTSLLEKSLNCEFRKSTCGVERKE